MEYKYGETICVAEISDDGKLMVTATLPSGYKVSEAIAVEDDSEYSFKVLKTKVKANGGAEGLLRFLERHSNGFGDVWVRQFFEGVLCRYGSCEVKYLGIGRDK